MEKITGQSTRERERERENLIDLKARPRLMNEEPCLLYKLLESASRATEEEEEEEEEARFNRRDASKAPTEAMAKT